MEATKRNPTTWFVYFFLIITCAFFTSSIKAQPPSSEDYLTELLDSAEIFNLRWQYDNAINLCAFVIQEAKKTDSWEHIARAYNEMAEGSRYLKKYDENLRYLQHSKKVLADHSDSLSAELARYYMYKAKRLNSLGEELDSVIWYYQKAISVLSKLENRPQELSYTYIQFGRFYLDEDSIKIANNYHSDAVKLLMQNPQKLNYFRGGYFYDLATFYNRMGDFERAILFIELARYNFNHSRFLDKNRLLNCETVLANIYNNLGEYPPAITHYKKIIEMSASDDGGQYKNLFFAYGNCGQAYLEMHEADSSIAFLLKSISTNKSENTLGKIVKAMALVALGEAYAEKKNYQRAEKNMFEALRLIIDVNGPKDYYTHVIYGSIGEYYEERGMFDRALDYYQKGIIALIDDFDSEDVYTDPDYLLYENPEEVLYILSYKSRTFYKRFLEEKNIQDLQAAYELYEIGYELLGGLLNSDYMDESKIQLFQGFKEMFNLSIECTFDLYRETGDPVYFHQAFLFIEKSRYFLLFKALANTVYKRNAQLTNEVFSQERQLSQDINELKFRLANISEDEDLSFSIRNTLLEKLNDRDAIWTQINSVGNMDLESFIDSLTLTIPEIQKNLIEKNELIVEYHWAKNYIYALTITRGNFDVHKINITPELEKQIEIYATCISEESDMASFMEEFHNYTKSAYYLYQKIVEPILPVVGEKENEEVKINRLTIVPDGPLSYLPFESFLTELPDTTGVTSYWSLPYFLDKITVRYAYSLNILKNNLDTEQKIEEPRLLAFSYSTTSDEIGDYSKKRSKDEIRYSAEELNSIKSRISNGVFYEDTEATEARFKTEAADFSIIHLALHGQADITDRYNSILLFKDDSTTSEDGKLHAYELYNMDLSNTEMAVLSACETGIGKQTEGEGIFSIARGFAYAGCPSILMSLWKVSDKTTAKIMDAFYKNLSKGMPKDEALQKAKIKYIEEIGDTGSHPSKWAAFIAMGNNQPLQIHGDSKAMYLWIVLVIMLLSGAVLFFSKKRN